MSTDFAIQNPDNFIFDRKLQQLFNNINSSSIQTAKEAGLIYNEGLFNNMLNIVKSEMERNRSHFDDQGGSTMESNDKFIKLTNTKYSKFLKFIKQRHFKSFSEKNKKFRGFSSDLLYEKNKNRIKDSKKIKKDEGLFITQQGKKRPKVENKTLILYKKIFDQGLDEANVYSNIKLIPLLENNTIDNRNNFEFEEIRDIKLATGNKFFQNNKPEVHNKHLVLKQGFINFHTNLSMKKGKNLLKRPSSRTTLDDKFKLENEHIDELFYKTSTFPKMYRNELEDLKAENFSVMMRTNFANNTAPNPWRRDKLKQIDAIKRKTKAENELGIGTDNKLFQPLIVNSKNNTANNTSRHFFKEEMNMTTDRFTVSFHLSRSRSKNNVFSKHELNDIIKNKQKRFNVLKKRVFNNKNQKEIEKFETIKNNSVKLLKCESLVTPFLSVDKNRRKPTVTVHKKERSPTRFEFDFKEKKLTKALYNIFDKEEVDFVLKQNKYKGEH